MAKGKITKECADVIAENQKKWDSHSKEWQEQWVANIGTGTEEFSVLWDTLKEIEKKCNVDPWGVAWDVRYKGSYAVGQERAKNYKQHGLKELYDAHLGLYPGVCDYEFIEFNDEVCELWCHACPVIQPLRDLGRTEEEIKEMCPLFCIFDYGIMDGFNPELENFPQPLLIMKGDPHCSYRTENRRPKAQRGK